MASLWWKKVWMWYLRVLSYTWECSEISNKSIHSRAKFWCDQCEYKNTTKTIFNGYVEQNMRKKYKFVNWEYKVSLQSNLKMKQIYTYRSNVWMWQVWIQVYRENYSHIRRPVGSGSELVLVTSHWCVTLLLWYENAPIY